MVGLARRRARRALRAHGKASRAAACALWAALALSVAAGSTAALYASGSQWVAARSSNALDELYYATIDEFCYSLTAAGVGSDDALRAALSPVKSPSPYLTEGINRHYSRFSHYLLYLFGLPERSIYGYRTYRITRLLFWPNYPKNRESVEIEAEGGAVAQGDEIILNVKFPLHLLDARSDKDDSIEVRLLYLVNEKEVIPYDESWWDISISEGREPRPGEVKRFLSKREIAREAAVLEAVRIVKEEMLPAFLTRGGTASRFSADFEEDGVTVDLHKDASDL